MNERARHWATVLVKHRPRYLQAKRLFAVETMRLALAACAGNASRACRRLGILRSTMRYAEQAWRGAHLSGPQAEAVRGLARELYAEAEGDYRKSVQLFRELVASAALAEAPLRRRKGDPPDTPTHQMKAAAFMVHVHRNSLRRMRTAPAPMSEGSVHDAVA